MDDVRLIRVEFVFIVDGLRVGSHQFPFLLIPKSNIFLFTVLFPFFLLYKISFFRLKDYVSDW